MNLRYSLVGFSLFILPRYCSFRDYIGNFRFIVICLLVCNSQMDYILAFANCTSVCFLNFRRKEIVYLLKEEALMIITTTWRGITVSICIRIFFFFVNDHLICFMLSALKYNMFFYVQSCANSM